MKITVLHFIASLETGGAERMLVTLLKNRKNEDIKHVVCTIYDKGHLISELKKSGIDYYSLNISSRFLLPLAFVKLFILIRKIKPDIIESYMLQENIIARIAGRICGKKVISGKRDTDRHKPKYKVMLDKLTMNLADLHVSNSLAGAKELISYGIKEDIVKHIPNGKDFQEFQINLAKEKAKENLGFNKDDFILGCVARLYKYKGLEYAIRAMPEILKINPNAKLVFVGSGDMLNVLQNLASELGVSGSVFLFGERNDIPKVLKAFDIFVFPSLREGMPGAVMEAMASDLPVVATNIDGNVELINDKKEGMIVQAEDSSAIAEAVIELMKNPEFAQMLAINARKKMLEEYNVEKMVKSFEKVYVDLCKSG